MFRVHFVILENELKVNRESLKSVTYVHLWCPACRTVGFPRETPLRFKFRLVCLSFGPCTARKDTSREGLAAALGGDRPGHPLNQPPFGRFQRPISRRWPASKKTGPYRTWFAPSNLRRTNRSRLNSSMSPNSLATILMRSKILNKPKLFLQLNSPFVA